MFEIDDILRHLREDEQLRDILGVTQSGFIEPTCREDFKDLLTRKIGETKPGPKRAFLKCCWRQSKGSQK